MSDTQISSSVRRLTRDDADAYRTLYLEALRHHPTAFSADLDDEASVPTAAFADRLTRSVNLGGFVDGRLGAAVTYKRQPMRKRQHVATMTNMYVSDRFRGQGLAKALLDQVVQLATLEVDQLELLVNVNNSPARQLYRSFGFEPFGVMRRALYVDDAYHDAEMLVLILR